MRRGEDVYRRRLGLGRRRRGLGGIGEGRIVLRHILDELHLFGIYDPHGLALIVEQLVVNRGNLLKQRFCEGHHMPRHERPRSESRDTAKCQALLSDPPSICLSMSARPSIS